jgi:putative hydrolase of the HAD superfamily
MGGLRRPRGVLLDLGNTILREEGFDAAAGRARLLALAVRNPRGVTAGEYAARAAAVDAEIQPARVASRIEFGVARVTRLLADHFGLSYAADDDALELAFWRASVRMRREPNVERALDALSARALPVGVVSNTGFSAHELRDELERHGLGPRFAFVMASADYGLRKPHPMLFEAAAARLGQDPADVWFVGDHPEFDLAGARAAGMTAVWYAPGAADREGARADARLRDWADLEALLERAGAPGPAARAKAGAC